MKNNRLVSFVLGGTKGLGASIVNQCQANGDYIVVGGSSIKTEFFNDDKLLLPCDLSNDHSIHVICDRLGQNILEFPTIPTIDRFFWVAGSLLKGDFADQDFFSIRHLVDINFRNSVLIAHAVWREMLKSNRDCQFVVISSSSGMKARDDEAIYVATKHAQVGFTRSLGLESERLKSNIKVSLFMPGGMQTPFWDNNPQDNFDGFLDPSKVARVIVDSVVSQTEYFKEMSIPRDYQF